MFYRHKMMADGLLGKCKFCTKKDVSRRYYSPAITKIKTYEVARNKTPERKLAKQIYQKKHRSESPGKYKAVSALGNAIKDGRIIRQPCEVCGDPKSEGHHEDYRKKLDVVWLCLKHHRERHKARGY